MSSALYAKLLGKEWQMLAENIRLAHSVESEVRGHFCVTRGNGWFAQRLAGLARLPQANNSVEASLKIVTEGQSQRWERRFANETFTTKQWEGTHGQLVERFGQWELSFKIRVDAGNLLYEQFGAKICFAGLCISMPRACAPFVVAKEVSEGTRVIITVFVTLPLVGRLISYEGFLDMRGTT
jgi:hypothetical protein